MYESQSRERPSGRVAEWCATLRFVVKPTTTPAAMVDADVDALQSAGFSDRDILDIVEVVA